MDPISIAAIGSAVGGLFTKIVNAVNPPPSAIIAYPLPGERQKTVLTYVFIGVAISVLFLFVLALKKKT